MSYNPEYYGAPDTQGTERSLLEGELNVVNNINNESKNKEAIIKANEDTYPEMQVSPTRDLLPGEINVVEKIRDYDKNKSSIITQNDEEVQVGELKQEINQLKEALESKIAESKDSESKG